MAPGPQRKRRAADSDRDSDPTFQDESDDEMEHPSVSRKPAKSNNSVLRPRGRPPKHVPHKRQKQENLVDLTRIDDSDASNARPVSCDTVIGSSAPKGAKAIARLMALSTNGFPRWDDGDVYIQVRFETQCHCYKLHRSVLVRVSSWFRTQFNEGPFDIEEPDPALARSTSASTNVDYRYEVLCNSESSCALTRTSLTTFIDVGSPRTQMSKQTLGHSKRHPPSPSSSKNGAIGEKGNLKSHAQSSDKTTTKSEIQVVIPWKSQPPPDIEMEDAHKTLQISSEIWAHCKTLVASRSNCNCEVRSCKQCLSYEAELEKHLGPLGRWENWEIMNITEERSFPLRPAGASSTNHGQLEIAANDVKTEEAGAGEENITQGYIGCAKGEQSHRLSTESMEQKKHLEMQMPTDQSHLKSAPKGVDTDDSSRDTPSTTEYGLPLVTVGEKADTLLAASSDAEPSTNSLTEHSNKKSSENVSLRSLILEKRKGLQEEETENPSLQLDGIDIGDKDCLKALDEISNAKNIKFNDTSETPEALKSVKEGETTHSLNKIEGYDLAPEGLLEDIKLHFHPLYPLAQSGGEYLPRSPIKNLSELTQEPLGVNQHEDIDISTQIECKDIKHAERATQYLTSAGIADQAVPQKADEVSSTVNHKKDISNNSVKETVENPSKSTAFLRGQAYKNLFRIYYSNAPKIDLDISTALKQTEILLELAAFYGSEVIVRPYLNNSMLQFGRDLYRAILKEPIRWLQLSIRLQSTLIFKESVIHVVGKCFADPLALRDWDNIPAELIDFLEYKLSSLRDIKAHVDGLLFCQTISIDKCDLLINLVNKEAQNAWHVVQQWREWFVRAISKPEPTRNLDVAIPYRTISEGSEAYLPLEYVITNLKKLGCGDFLDEKIVALDLKMLKENARGIVQPLCENHSMLSPKEMGIGYFTCTKIETHELPWITHDSSKNWAS